ncbi:TetR/AcrR family transcriptional regulator [Chloroflexota bacterium]
MPKVIDDGFVYQAVMQVVSECGYAGATTKQMADAADISEMTLFRRYGSKVQLVRQAIAHIVSQAGFSSAAEYTGDLRVDLERIVQAYQAAAVKNGLFFMALFSEAARVPDLLDSFDQPLEIFHSIEELIVRYQEEGKLRQENPMQSVAALLGPLMYFSLMQKGLGAGLVNIDLDDHVEAFLEGRRRREG